MRKGHCGESDGHVIDDGHVIVIGPQGNWWTGGGCTI